MIIVLSIISFTVSLLISPHLPIFSKPEEMSLQEFRRARLEAQANRARKSNADRHSGNRRLGSNPDVSNDTSVTAGKKHKPPDYVNIAALQEAKDIASVAVVSSTAMTLESTHAAPTEGHEYVNLPFPNDTVKNSRQYKWDGPENCNFSSSPSCLRRRHCSEPNRLHREGNHSYDDDDGGDGDMDEDDFYPVQTRVSDKYVEVKATSMRKYFQDEATQTYDSNVTYRVANAVAGSSVPPLCSNSSSSLQTATSGHWEERALSGQTSNDTKNSKDFGGAAGNLTGNMEDILSDGHSVEEVRNKDRFFHGSYVDQYYREFRNRTSSLSRKTWESYSDILAVQPSTLHDNKNASLGLPPWPQNGSHGLENVDVGEVANQTLVNDEFTTTVEPPEPFRSDNVSRNSDTTEAVFGSGTRWSPSRDVETKPQNASSFCGVIGSDQHVKSSVDAEKEIICVADQPSSCSLATTVESVANNNHHQSESRSTLTAECSQVSDHDMIGADMSDYQKQKESPPKNIVQDRIRIFESQADSALGSQHSSPVGKKGTTDSIGSAVSSKSSSPSGGLFVPVLTESSPYLGDLPDSKGPKNTVDSQTTVSSCCSDTKLLPLRPFRRRFHSDTETLMYESSTPSSCSDSSVDEGDPDSVSATTRRKKTTRIGHEEQQHLSNLKAGVIRLPSSTKEQTPNDGREYEKKDVGSETISRKFSVLEKDAEHFMDDIDGKTKDDRSLGNGGVSPSNVSGYFENALTQKNGTEAEEYYLPMNGCGTGILGSSSVLDGSTLERFSTVPPSSKFWHFEATGSNVSLEAEEAVYVQMDGYSAFGIQTSNQTKLSSLSMISPIEDSYSDPQEGQTDGPNANLDRGCTKDIDRGEVEGSGRKTSSTSSDMDEGSVPKGNSTVNTTNSLENYGYYEIPDSSLFTKHPTLTDDPMSSHYEPIYAEPKQITGVATGQLAPPLPDRFFDTCVDERHQTSLLVSRQRNASPITSLSSKVPELPSRDCLAARTSGVDVAEMATNHHKPHSSKTYKWTTGSIHRRKRDVDLSATQSSASDADDEASKDFDTHPRFSLSDSFRPASYYLKVSAATLATKDKNRAERSSEEELESPPPIPLSPPPLLFCETDTMDGMISPRPGNDDGQRTKGLSATNVEAVLARTIRPKERVRFDTSSQRKSTDASTVTAPPTSPLHSKLNYSYYRVYEDDRRITEMLFKPVPVESALPSRSAPSSPTSSGPNMVVERASTKDSAISLALPSSLPKMNLQVRRLRIYDEGKSAANSKFKPLSSQSSGSSTSACHEPSDPVISSSSKDYRIPITMLKDAGTQWSPPVSVSSEGDLDNGVVNVQTRATSTPEDGNGSNSESGSGGVRAKRSPLSAPYYYSDLLREDERGFGSSDLGFSSSTSISSDRGLSSRMASGPSPGGSNLHQHQYRYQLNNSRSVGSGGGGGLRRDEIGRKVNNIELAQNRGLRSVQQQGTFNRQGERVNVATELTNSIVYLEAKKLAGAERNTYESDTLKKMTRGLSLDCAGLRASQTQALALAGVDVRNVYPSGIVGEKLAPATSTSSFGHFSSHTQSQNRPQRLSRSLEGLLVDDALLPSANDQGAVLEQSSASRRLWPLQTSTDRVLEKHSNMSTNRMPRQNRSRRMAFDDQSGENLRTARSLEELDEPDEGYLQQHRHHNSRQNHFLAEGQRLEGFRIDHGLLQHWDVPRSGIAAPPSTAHGTLNWEMTGSFDERSVAAPSSSSQTSMTCDTVRTVGNGGWEDSTVHDTSQQQQSHFLGVGPPDSLTLPDDADGGRPSRHPDHHLPFLVLRGRSDFDGGGRDDFKIDSRDILVEGGSRSLQHVPKHHLTEDIKDLDAIVVNESSEEEEETAHQSRLEDCGGTSNATEGCCVAENGTDEGAVDEALESGE